jgi:hypothetical protein
LGQALAVRFVLVHSPVVGPSTWRWVAETLRSAGHDVVVPDLVGAAATGAPDVFAAGVVACCGSGDDTVVAAHSGAGAVLPSVIANLIVRPRRVVFVDAGLPPCAGRFTAGGGFLPTLRGLATAGVLPRWSQWWAPEMLAKLVPDPGRRNVIEVELPRIPLAWYEATIEVPPGWCRAADCAYVLLSDAYRDDAARAAELGWQVVERPGTHLDIVSDDLAIAEILVRFIDPPPQVRQRRGPRWTRQSTRRATRR